MRDELEQANEVIIEQIGDIKDLLDLIDKKCREHCGMRRAWNDGLCHATEQMCSLVPHSPIWAGKASLARPEPKVAPLDLEDL